jgi:hypothetical protein
LLHWKIKGILYDDIVKQFNFTISISLLLIHTLLFINLLNYYFIFKMSWHKLYLIAHFHLKDYNTLQNERKRQANSIKKYGLQLWKYCANKICTHTKKILFWKIKMLHDFKKTISLLIEIKKNHNPTIFENLESNFYL